MLDTGQTVDRYTVDSIIGYGGTAVVYLVKHVQLSTDHALKVLSVSSGAIRERMLREGRVQAALTHPNVVAVSDVLDVDGAPGLLMEFIEGPSLEDALKKFRISLDDAETLFRGIVLGVHAAHQTGLVHRDLKPANVLLAESEEGFVPKVTDFGLAKVLVGDGIEVGTTRAGIAMGTPSYMSPEQIRDARKVDQRADIFSLGCLLYELVTGQRAFPGDQALTIYNAITAGEYVPAEQLIPDLPVRIVQCIDGCLAQDREERIPDCGTVLEVMFGQLEWFVSPHPVPTEAIVERFHDDVPLMQVAGAFLDDDLTAGEFIGVDGSVDEDGSMGADAGFERPRPRRTLLWITAALLVAALFLGLIGLGVLLNEWADPLRTAMNATSSMENLSEPEPAPIPKVNEPKTPAPIAAVAELDAEDEEIPVEEASAEPEPADNAKTVTTTEKGLAPRPIRSHKPRASRKAPVEQLTPMTVKILSVPPNAALSVDGKGQGRTNKKIDLKTGAHRVNMQSGEREASFEIQVKQGATNKWCYDFEAGKVWNTSCPRP